MSKVQAGWMIAFMVVIIGLLSFDAIGSGFGTTPKWEYKVSSPSDYSLDRELKELGWEGWELVFARRASSDTGGAVYEMIFRRPLGAN